MLSATGSISGFAYLDKAGTGQMVASDPGFAGLTVQLRSVDSQGNLSAVSGVGPTQTASDGSYHFTGLSAGTYQVQIQPSAKLAVGTLSPGAAGGSAGTNEIQLALTDSQAATDYNFAILGAQSSYISLRMYLASTGGMSNYLTTLHAAPTVATGNASNSNYTATDTTGGSAVAVTASNAAITSTDSPTLRSMTVSIENLLDTAAEKLLATTTGTTLTQSYAAGVLTISGVADIATYQTVLHSVTYSDNSVSAHAGSRTISVVVDDGTATSAAATSTINVALGTVTVPSVTAVSSTQASGTYAAGTTIPITVTFSAAVTVTGTPQLTLNDGAVVNYTSGSGTSTLTFNYTVASGQNTSKLDYASTTALALNGGTILDSSGNAVTLTLPATGTDGLATKSIAINTNIGVTAVSSTKAAGSYTTGTTIPITITFGTTVTVTGTPQLTLNDGAVVNYASGSGTSTLTFTYTVAAGQNTAKLDYASTTALALNSGTILDSAGNAATLTLPATGIDGLAGQNIVIDTTAPAVTGVSSTQATGVYAAGTTIPITITFGEAVTVTGTPQLTLNSGTSVVATYASGSGTSTLTFNYVIASGQSTQDLDYGSTTALALNGGTIKDAAGNAATLTLPATGTDGLATKNIVVDTTARTVTAVSSTQASGSYKAGTTISITVTFGVPVTVTGTPQLALNAGSNVVASYASGTGTTTLTFTYTVASGQNTSDLDYASTTALTLNGGTINNAAGNAAILTLPATATDGLATKNIVIDTTSPAVSAVSSTQTAGAYSTGTTIPITVTFGEAVTVTGTPQLALNSGSNAVASYASGSGTSTLIFNYVVASGDNASRLDYASTTALALNGGTIKDAAGNDATLTLAATGTDGLFTKNIIILTAAPTVSAVSTSHATGLYGTAEVIPITVTFNNLVTVTGTPHLTLNNGAIVNYTSGSGTTALTFNYTVASGQDTQDLDYASTSALSLNGGTIKDAAGNAATLTLPATGTDGLAAKNISIDTTARNVTAVGSTKASGTYGTGTTIPITITFGEAMTVTGAPTLALNVGSGVTATYVSGSGTSTLTFNYVIAAGQSAQDLDYASTSALTLNGGTIMDPAGNPALLTLPATATDGLATKNIVINTTSPTVSAVSSTQAGGSYSVGTTIPITVTFNHVVNVAGTPRLALNSGANAVASYASGSGTSTLTFNYVVASGDNASPLDYASTSALSLNGGTIVDTLGNAATLTLPAIGSDGLAGKNIVILTSAPTVSAVASTQATGVYPAGTTIPITIAFNRAVTVTGTPQLTLNDGTGIVASYASGSGTATLTFNYIVASGENTQDLDYASTSALSLNGGTIQDAAGNAATLTLPATGTNGLATKNIVIDTTPRVVTAVSSPQSSGTYSTGITIPITVTFGEAVTVTGVPQLALNAGSGAVASYASGSGTATLTFNYTIASGDFASDLDYASTTALSLNGGTIHDAAGNPAILTLPATGTDGLATSNIVIATTPPAVASVASTLTAGSYKAGTTVPITIAFSHAVNVTGTPQLTLNDGAVADYSSGSGTATLTFNYTVAAGQNATTLDYASSSALSLNAGTIADVLGNQATLTLPATGSDGLASLHIVIDTTSPAVTAVSTTTATGTYGQGATIPISIAFGENVTVTGTPQLTLNDGAVVSYAGGSGSSTLTFNYTPASGQSTAKLDYASTSALQLNGGTINDAAGNAATLTLPATGTDGLASKTIVIDTTTVPSGYTISRNAATYDKTNAASASFQFTGGVVGDKYNYTVTSTGGTSSVTGSGTLTSATQTVSNIDLTSLIDGTLSFSVTLTNSLGNVGAAATDSATLLRSAVTLDQTTYTPTSTPENDTNVGFTMTTVANQNNFNYNWAFYLNGSITSIRGSGTVTSTSMHISNVDISSLPSGNYVLHVIFTNPANSGASNTNGTLTLDRPVSAFTIAAAQAYIPAGADSGTGFIFSGAESTTTYKYTVTSSNGGGPTGGITGSGSVYLATQSVYGIDVSSLHDGTITYSVVLTDLRGNVSAAQTATSVLDRVAPTGYSLSVPSLINAAASTNTSFTIISSSGDIGDTFVYTIASNKTTTTVTHSGTITAASQQITGVDVSSFPDGTLSFSVALTDPAGNHGTTTTPVTATLNTVIPTGYTIAADASVIGSTTTAQSAGFTITSPSAEIGDTFTYTTYVDLGSPPVAHAGPTGSGTITAASQDITGIDVSGLPDGTLTYSVTLTNAAGNHGTAAKATATLAKSAPSGFSIQADQSTINAVGVSSAGFTISDALAGDTYHFTVVGTGITGSGTMTAATQDITGIDLSSLPDGAITFSVTLTDVASHTSSAVTASATIDRSAPTAIALSSSSAPDGQSAGSLVGLLETVGPQSSSQYTYTLVSGAGGTDNASFQISSNELLTNAVFDSTVKSTYDIRLRSTDAAGKTIEQQFLVTVNASDPIAATLALDNSTVAAGQPAGTTVGNLTAGGAAIGSTVTYSLVSEPGSSDNNSSFKIVNNQLQTNGSVTAGTYTVRVRSSSTFLLSDVVNLTNITGPTAYQVSYDPAVLPSETYRIVAADAGLITLATDGAGTGNWYPAVSTNSESAGSLAQPNYLGPYSGFWSSVTAANASATLKDVVGSSGVDLATKTAWAVIDKPGEYAVAATVFTEQVFTITVS